MKGTMSVAGTGPGNPENLTPMAQAKIRSAEVVVGYDGYLELISPLLGGKTIISSGMRKEVERCGKALEQYRQGRHVVLVSGGDAGVYGLAGLVLELMTPDEQTDLVVVPGITSATACAALLGAPLIHDFVVISLSDLLTDVNLIEKRLRLAAEGDFVTVIYNPKSLKRHRLFLLSSEIFLQHRQPDTPVGIVQNAYRDTQRVEITSLQHLGNQNWVDMKTTLIIGNSQTRVSGNRMITPRGYSLDKAMRIC